SRRSQSTAFPVSGIRQSNVNRKSENTLLLPNTFVVAPASEIKAPSAARQPLFFSAVHPNIDEPSNRSIHPSAASAGERAFGGEDCRITRIVRPASNKCKGPSFLLNGRDLRVGDFPRFEDQAARFRVAYGQRVIGPYISSQD